MLKGGIGFLCILAILAAGCEFKSSTGDDANMPKSKVVSSADQNALHGAVIKNEIELDASGVKLKEAYLVDE